MMGQVTHVREAMPDGLVGVESACYDHMIRKNRIRIDSDVVGPAFPAVETQGALLFRPMAEETFPRADLLHVHRPGG